MEALVDAVVESLRNTSTIADAHRAVDAEIADAHRLEARIRGEHPDRAARVAQHFAAWRRELERLRAALAGDAHERVSGAVGYERHRALLVAKIMGACKGGCRDDADFDSLILRMRAALYASGWDRSRPVAGKIASKCRADRLTLRIGNRVLVGANAVRVIRKRLRELDALGNKPPSAVEFRPIDGLFLDGHAGSHP